MSVNQIAKRVTRPALVFTIVLLAIEFLDELVDGSRGAAWPLIRDDLGLTYTQVGLLLSVPSIISTLIEPPLGIVGDIWKRRVLVVGGGLLFGTSVLLVGVAPSFPVLLLAFILFYPASGAFVSLSQATLMDLEPERHEQLMAQWTVSGSLGVMAGPLALSLAALLGFGWRGLFIAIALLAFGLTFLAARQPFPNGHEEGESVNFRAGLRDALAALRRRAVVRWLLLLEFSDLTGDILSGFLALYFVDVVGTSPFVAGAALAVWNGAGLLGDLLLVPLLQRVRGLAYLRWSVIGVLVIYPAFLLAPTLWLKVLLLGAMSIAGTGWYAILMGQLYTAMPGRSGTVMSVTSVSGLVGGFAPALLGIVAERYGLQATLWLLVLGPLALLVGLPRTKN